MMDEMIPFLRTIAKYPDDDAPRLVFADWLEERDHVARAKFIRLQIELSHMQPSDPGYPEKTAAMRRCGIFTEPGRYPFFDHLPSEQSKIAFERGFIGAIDTADTNEIDSSGFDRIPLQTLVTNEAMIEDFKKFKHLKCLHFRTQGQTTPARFKKIFGPKGWFKNLEELAITNVSDASLRAGVIPEFELPQLRNFFLSTDAFHDFEERKPKPSVRTKIQSDDESEADSWNGLVSYLPINALPNSTTSLERFLWYTEDDSDYFEEEDFESEGWFWRGPTMKSLFESFNCHKMKQVEMIVDYDDHESGDDGIIPAPFDENPLTLSPHLECVTSNIHNLDHLRHLDQKLKGLRIYDSESSRLIFDFLNEPVCSELEHLFIQDRGEGLGTRGVSPMKFSRLNSLHLQTDWRFSGEFISNCDCPGLISLQGRILVQAVIDKEWPQLQTLSLRFEKQSEIQTFAKSKNFPNLTTLIIDREYSPKNLDYSILAKRLFIPHLSVVHLLDDTEVESFIVGEAWIPVRSDIIMKRIIPKALANAHVAFSDHATTF